MAAELPPQLRNQIQLLQQLQQQAQIVVAQRSQVELQVRELEKTIQELGKVADDAPIYRSVGGLLVRARDKAAVLAEVKESKETADVRLTSLRRQEEKLREKFAALQKEVQAALALEQRRGGGARGA